MIKSYKDTTLVIDAGNTRIKIGVFKNEALVEVIRFGNEEWNDLKSFLLEYRFTNSVVSSVRSDKDTRWILQMLQNPISFNGSQELLLKHVYQTPETLGSDRLSNVLAASKLATSSALVIDIGTCIKFDVIDQNKCYLGGSISPGINLRYKSLHDYTCLLPLLNDDSNAPIIGDSTESCMHSGVMQGIQGEINHFVSYYVARYQDLTIFVTGGDAHCFDIDSKNNIFVEQNLTLYGLYYSIHSHAY